MSTFAAWALTLAAHPLASAGLHPSPPSGKSTILSHFKEGRAAETIPTIGFAVSTFSTAKLAFTAFDMSGQGKYRDLWPHYYEDADAIIWVVDSADRGRICVVRDELDLMLEHQSGWGVVLWTSDGEHR